MKKFRHNKIFLKLYFFKKYNHYFFKNNFDIGFFNKLKCYFSGFFPKNFVLYNLKVNNKNEYISDYEENYKLPLLNTRTEIINDKLKFLEFISEFVYIPKNFGILKDGKLYDKISNEYTEVDKFIYDLKVDGIIIKPIDGDGGENIFKLTKMENEYFLNGNVTKVIDVVCLLNSLENYFVSELLIQHEYAQKIFNETVNTIRFLTILNPISKKSEIVAVAHRIGNKKSIPVDNCAKGGFTANIDINSGRIGKAVRTYFKGNKPIWYCKHPDSNSDIEDVIIPDWDRIKKLILFLSEKFPEIIYIGWDVVLLNTGEITILEANQGADLKLHQVHTPLLKNKSFKEFCKFYKIKR